ncbi:zf-HC2 domain-containing protein [Parablautia muri]|uniref:Anti-sigma-W factor RsiW n=1 Tax=Parablautia muri TaxID=2320879 RepID=A0A9X5BD29_9FIRM|nr:anti-sigma factor [Parablautia muri]NBJ91605.1 zf-HC2 domain-containing protein [Parablautia muri]
MVCKEIENMIPAFLADDLDTEDLRDFMEHVDNCEECMEELSIQFLVLEGLARLEAGNVFDLQNELKVRLEEAAHSLKRREGMQGLLYILEGLVVIAAIGLVALLLVL